MWITIGIVAVLLYMLAANFIEYLQHKDKLKKETEIEIAKIKFGQEKPKEDDK